jgi:hypothetical protein
MGRGLQKDADLAAGTVTDDNELPSDFRHCVWTSSSERMGVRRGRA